MAIVLESSLFCHTSEEWTALGTWALVIATILLWLWAFKTLRSQNKLNNPFLMVSESGYSVINGINYIQWIIQNHGNTVAANVIVEMGWDFDPASINYSVSEDGLVMIAPKGKKPVFLPFVDDDADLSMLKILLSEGSLELYLAIHLYYKGGDNTKYKYSQLSRYHRKSSKFETVKETIEEGMNYVPQDKNVIKKIKVKDRIEEQRKTSSGESSM